MNDNSYIDWPKEKFIDVLEGKDANYIQRDDFPGSIGQRAYGSTLKSYSLKNDFSIYVPNQQERLQHKLIGSHDLNQTPNAPAVESTIVYRISEKVTWDRRANRGEGSELVLAFGVNLLNCEFQNTFSILNVQSTRNLVIDNCSFASHESVEKDLEIGCSTFESVDIIGSTRIDQKKSLKEININLLETNRLLLSGLTIDKLIINCEFTYIDQITIHECTIAYVEIKGHSIGNVFFSNTYVSRSLRIDIRVKQLLITSFNLLDSEKKVFSEVYVNLHNDEDKGEYVIQDISIGALSISGINNNKVLIKNCEVSTLSFDHLSNVGELKMQAVNKVKALLIYSSSLGNAEFLTVDFSGTTQTEVIDSNLLDVIFINTSLPYNLASRSTDDYRGIREVFRQLKVASGRQGNRIQELKYEALEMSAYERDEATNKTKDEKFILWLNKITNNHGQSWSRAAIMLIIVTVVLFIIIKSVFGYTHTFRLSSYQVSQYLEFAVNPLHNFEKIFETEINYNPSNAPWAKIIDIVSKLLEGILLFQLIRAFRKYVR